MRILLPFLVFSEVLFILGPIDFKIDNMFITVVYLFFMNMMLFWGYKKGLQKAEFVKVQLQSKIQTVKCFIIISLILTYIKLGIAAETYSIFGIINQVINGLLSPKEVYAQKLEAEATSTMTYVFMILSPITMAAIPFGLVYWKKLSYGFRILMTMLILEEISYWLAIGTRKGLFDVILVGVFSLCLANPKFASDKKYWDKIKYPFIFFFLIFIIYFMWSNMSRLGADDLQDLSSTIADVKPIYQDLPLEILVMLSSIESYFCQGYHALSLSLKEFVNGEICFTWGVGNNFFLINVMDKFGLDVIENTYQGLLSMKYDIDPYIKWHSVYVWLANDFTFIGVPFIIYFVGKILAITWKKSLCNNFYAIPTAILFVQIVAYSFANNQVMSFSFIALLFWTFMCFSMFNFKRI